jgi:hypothetical protein
MAFRSFRSFKKISELKNHLLWTIALLLSIYFVFHFIANAAKPSHGFATYYTAARLLLEGEDVSNFYDDYWFSSKVENYVPGVYEIYLVNMPTTAFFIFLPVANFDYKTARVIWIIFNLIILAIVVGLIIKRMKIVGIWLPLILILFFSFQPLYANITYGQIYVFIFCLLVLAWFEFESDNEKLPGIILGLIFILKTAGMFLWILFAIQKKWESILWLFVTMATVFFVSLPIVGIDSWFINANKVLGYSSSPTLSVTAYQSIHSFFHHFFVFDKQWNPEPLINLPFIGKSFTIIFSMLILIITISSVYKFRKLELAFGTFIIAGIILSPASIDYHYMLMMIPILILFNWLIKNPSPVLWGLFFISFILIAASIPYISTKIAEGLWAIFAYPKLFGALGLWVLSLRAAYISKCSESGLLV